MSHTATPWRLRLKWPDGPPSCIEGALVNADTAEWYGRWVCVFEKQFTPEQTLADAHHIVKCVNERDELVDAVRQLVGVLVRCDAETMPNDLEQCTDEEWNEALAAGQAILAKVSA